MIHGFTCARRPAATCLVGIVLAVIALGARSRATAAVNSARRQAESTGRDLQAKAEAAAPYDQPHLDELRLQVHELQMRLGDGGSWAQVREILGGRWRPEAVAAADHKGFSIRTGTFRMTAATTTDWPAIVAAVEALERIPGVGIGALEAASGGLVGRGSLDLVRITVVVQSRRGGAERPSHEKQ